jgi:Do/DeqQ family serine protease
MASYDPIDYDPLNSPPRPRTPPLRRGFVVVLTSLLLLAGLVYGVPHVAEQVGYRYEVGRSKAATEVLAKLDKNDVISSSSALFRLASTRVHPAVVNVRTEKVAPIQQPPNAPAAEQFGRIPFGSGSGVVIDKDRGFIVTNNHVIRDADGITVRLGRREIPARLVGADQHTDLAVLQVAGGLSAEAEWGDSKELDIGDWVLAIGSPFELDRTVTAGIVSATGRGNLPTFTFDDYQDYVQTDAAINPGNSGGPLINLKGEVVGINTAILTETGASQGIGLAISSRLARRVVEQLIEKGRVIRGYLGVSIRDVGLDEARALNLDEPKGAWVNEVVPGSPAEAIGLKTGDVVIDLAGEPIADSSSLRNQTVGLNLDRPVSLTYLRDGRSVTVQVKIAEMPLLMDLGLQVVELKPEDAKLLPDAPETALIISGVSRGSPAFRAGLQRGLRIGAVGPVPVRTLDELNRAVASKFSAEEGITLQIETLDGRPILVNIGGPNPGPRKP